jgi:very-short-patch-repair endonuclease
MLLRGRRRLVIEIDGKHHYADGDHASPRLYAEMMREDRALRLDGYEVFRFGGYDFCDAAQANVMVREFLENVLRAHGYLPTP